MIRWRRSTTPVLAMALAFVLAACAPTPGPTDGPTANSATSPAASPGATAPATPSAAVPGSPSAPPVACAVTRQTGVLPSDRLVDLAISSTSTHDLLTFVFAPASAPSPAGPPRGTLDAAEPPFSFAGSGLEFDLLGQHAIRVRFSGMTIASESGEATYHGPTDAKPDLPALREAIQYDASEGIVGWYVGYDGTGCVTLVRDGNALTVMIAHPEAPAG